MLSRLMAQVLPHVAGVSNKVIDCYLTQDVDYLQDLQGLAGKKILVSLTDLHLSLEFSFSRTKMKLEYYFEHPAKDGFDLSLLGASFNLLAFGIKKDQRSKMLSEGLVEFHGDLFLLEHLAHLFSEREFLENVPLPAMLKSVLLKATKSGFAWQKHNLKVLQKSLIDYLQEELKLLPSHRHFEFLQEDVFLLNQTLDRLEAWVDRFNAVVS